MNLQPYKNFNASKLLRQKKGQLIVEYVLLIFIVVSIATLMTRMLVGRGEGDNGIIITKWSQMLNMVGQDLGD